MQCSAVLYKRYVRTVQCGSIHIFISLINLLALLCNVFPVVSTPLPVVFPSSPHNVVSAFKCVVDASSPLPLVRRDYVPFESVPSILYFQYHLVLWNSLCWSIFISLNLFESQSAFNIALLCFHSAAKIKSTLKIVIRAVLVGLHESHRKQLGLFRVPGA